MDSLSLMDSHILEGSMAWSVHSRAGLLVHAHLLQCAIQRLYLRASFFHLKIFPLSLLLFYSFHTLFFTTLITIGNYLAPVHFLA